QAVGAVLLVQRVAAALDGLPTVPGKSVVEGREPAQVGQWRRQGGVWHLRWRETTSVVPDSKGMRDLAVLLARPGKPVAALDLAMAPAGSDAPPASGGGLGEVLDTTARRAYRARLSQLDDELATTVDAGRAH